MSFGEMLFGLAALSALLVNDISSALKSVNVFRSQHRSYAVTAYTRRAKK